MEIWTLALWGSWDDHLHNTCSMFHLQWASMMLLEDSPKYRSVADMTAKTITLGSTFFCVERKDKWFTLSKWWGKQLRRDVSTPMKEGTQPCHALPRLVSSSPKIFECLLWNKNKISTNWLYNIITPPWLASAAYWTLRSWCTPL